jgi:hypothetical protein
LRPGALALLLLASGDLRPRQRARDQQADTAGLALKRRLLQGLVDLDPEPEGLEAALVDLVEQCGPATGPARAVAVLVREEWQAARDTPEWVAHLIAEAVRESQEGGNRGRRPV